ncbi:MAG: PIG-L family deacetylase [Comamonadaceae bacterium]|jgi:LmbE family N-acetylglucosaminyl deacetylase|uniref:PIG-L deacetylase family protein n=1 Tax=Candidatus Skiveiella danica TaxID=3386177 RepID=UPI00390A0BE8|nr:PIG-L family deacetylase [Comamonadaceae bacterium]MBK6556441.1 PIG-L family deacetylase [Comamonadaceae bacterium]MBK7509079.1 PIG-L family deacetylase [Comamonadaceae bacterium]
MPTENDLLSTSIFLFAHQDDEFGIFQKILDELEAGNLVCCAYLTNGALGPDLANRRNRESLTVLLKLGVDVKNIFFAGDILGISDSKLLEHLDLASNWIRNWWSRIPRIQSVYIPAWEGGHPDHDALHAITLRIAQDNIDPSRIQQFSLYNGYQCSGPLFRVLSPLPNNGPTNSRPIAWNNRLKFLSYCLQYPSQRKTWIGLFPFVLMHYIFYGLQATQPTNIQRIRSRPHSGLLYYERRGFCTWDNLTTRINNWNNTV